MWIHLMRDLNPVVPFEQVNRGDQDFGEIKCLVVLVWHFGEAGKFRCHGRKAVYLVDQQLTCLLETGHQDFHLPYQMRVANAECSTS